MHFDKNPKTNVSRYDKRLAASINLEEILVGTKNDEIIEIEFVD